MKAGVGWLVAATVLAVVLGGCSERGSEDSTGSLVTLGVGEPFAAVQLSGDRPALVWVFDVDQCLGCKLGDPARVVRALQRGLGEGLETVALAIGDGRGDEREIVGGFLASQRVEARVEVRSHEQYLREFGAAPLAVLYVMNRNSVVEAAVAADSAEIWRSADGRLDLAGFVARLAEQGVAQDGEGPGM